MESDNYSLLVLSYPVLEKGDLELVQEIRSRLDPESADILPPHFTHVLPLDISWQRTVEMAMKELAGQIDPLEFRVKTLTILDEPETQENYLVLILENYEPLLQLHLTMYEQMGLPAPFGEEWIPHLTIGVSKNRQMLIDEAKKLKTSVAGIQGVIESIEIVKWRPGEIVSIANLPLSKN